MTTSGQDVLARTEVDQLHKLGLSGRDVNIAVLDSGLEANNGLTSTIVDERDFAGVGGTRHNASGHGTIVANCINLVAPDAGLGIFNVTDKSGNARRETLVRALEHCIEVFPFYRVINISIGFDPDGCPGECPLCIAVDKAYRRGMLVIVSAGNRGPEPGTLTCPAHSPWALVSIATISAAVEEYWEENKLHKFWATHVTGDFARSYGTSYSAAYSSGSAALHFQEFPKLTADTLRYARVNVMETMRAEGKVTLSAMRVREHLLWLQSMSNSGAFFIKNGALRSMLETF